MSGMNLVVLMGNVGHEPELRHAGAMPILNLRIATTTSKWMGKEKGRVENTQWHNVAVVGGRAEALQRILSIGSQVLVRGELHYGSYTNRDGVKVNTTEIRCEELELCGSRGGGQRPRLTQNDVDPDPFNDGPDDDIPF